MNHRVNSVQQLHEDANSLYNNVVIGGGESSADTIINNLHQGISILKSTWEGRDAGVQIQNVIDIHNAMVIIRNALGQLAADSSKIASNYREIQNANGAGLEAFSYLTCDPKTVMEAYSDLRDTINISAEANNGKQKIDAANNAIDTFIAEVTRHYNAIMENWMAGTGRENAQEAFNGFISQANRYKETLSSVSTSITTAIQNYTF